MNYLSLANAAKVVDWARTLVTQLQQRDAAQDAAVIDVVHGGTGATTASAARSNLGLGTMAMQNANAVAITGGSVQGLGSPVTVSNFSSFLNSNANTKSLTNGATVTFSNFSGLIIVNNQNAGNNSAYIMGGGYVTHLGAAGSQVGSFAFTGGNYVFTNNTGSTATFSFLALQTRNFT